MKVSFSSLLRFKLRMQWLPLWLLACAGGACQLGAQGQVSTEGRDRNRGPDPDPEWPRFRGPGGNGEWNTPALPSDAALKELSPRKLWSQPLGAGYGGITVSHGLVFVMDRVKEPEEVERISCFDAQSGQLRWRHQYPVAYENLEYGSGPRASVTLHEGKAYTLGALGMALRLNANTGEVEWQVDTAKVLGAQPPRWGLAASPLIWKDSVILHVGASPAGSVVALDLATGKERWRSGDDAAGYATPMIIERSSQHEPQLIQWGPQHLFSVHPDHGTENWRFPYPIQYGVSIAQPIFDEERQLLLVSSYWHGTRVLRVEGTPAEREEPKLVWSEEKVLRGLMSQPLQKEGTVFLLDRSEGLIAFDLSDGTIRWKDGHHFTPKDRNPHISLVWAAKDRDLACGLNANGELFFARLTLIEYEELSRHQIIGKTWAHPAFSNRHVYARSDTEIAAWQLWE